MSSTLRPLLRSLESKFENRFWNSHNKSDFLIAAVLLSILCWGAYFWNGYFRYDDFEVVTVCAEGTLLDQLLVIHGDHTLPLFRIEMWFLLNCFGTNELFYNVFYFLIFIAVLLVTFFLLRQLETDSRAPYLFLLLFVTWIGWAHLVAGYYILSVYLQVVLFSSAAVLFLLKFQKSKRTAYAVYSLLMTFLSLAIELAGAIVIPILVVFVLAETRREVGAKQFIRNNFSYLSSLAFLVGGFFAYLWYVFEVLYPGRFLGMAGSPENWGGIFSLVNRSYSTLRDGIVHTLSVLNMFDLSRHSWIGDIVLLSLFVFGIAACVLAHKCGQGSLVRFLLAAAVSMMGCIVMSAIGRPLNAEFKHVVIAFYWFSLFLAVAISIILTNIQSRSIRTWLLVSVLLFCLLTPALVHLRLPNLQFSAARSNLYGAELRRKQIDDLVTQLVEPLKETPGVRHIPTLDGNYIFANYGFGLFKYDLSFLRQHVDLPQDRFVLYRNQAMSSWAADSVKTVDELQDVVDSSFKIQLTSNQSLRDLYLKPIDLNDVNSGVANRIKFPGDLISSFTPEVPVFLDYRNQEHLLFNNELDTRGGLVLKIFGSTSHREPCELLLFFENDFGASGPLGRIALGAEGDSSDTKKESPEDFSVEFAFDQIYAFSLSHSISKCRLQVVNGHRLQLNALELRRR